MASIDLGEPDSAFAQGGNRLCFVDPRNRDRCIKVDRLDKSPAMRQQESPFPKHLRPVRTFDENRKEYRSIHEIEKRCGDNVQQLIPRCYGFVDTNFGKGLVLELLRDFDRRISITLLQYLWQNGLNHPVKEALDKFARQWSVLGVPSRKLLLHNVIVQQQSTSAFRIVVIDGLGWPTLIQLGKYSRHIAKYQARKKVSEMFESIDGLFQRKQAGLNYGIHGWLAEEKRNIP